eukprot:COSAG02_NODE_71646_length_190_cov_27.065934_1_plen_41_part_10
MGSRLGSCSISVKYEISYVSYRDLVLECEPWCLEHELLREG